MPSTFFELAYTNMQPKLFRRRDGSRNTRRRALHTTRSLFLRDRLFKQPKLFRRGEMISAEIIGDEMIGDEIISDEMIGDEMIGHVVTSNEMNATK